MQNSKKHTLLAVIFALSGFVFYGFNNLVYWLYSHKQYMIAVSVPIMAKGPKAKDEALVIQKKLILMRRSGVVFNFALCTAMMVVRYFIVMSFGRTAEVSPGLKYSDYTFNFLLELVLLGSAVLLFIALKKFKRIFKDNKNFKENKKVMRINFFVGVAHMILEFFLVIFVEKAFVDK
jgi:hypothetical protein